MGISEVRAYLKRHNSTFLYSFNISCSLKIMKYSSEDPEDSHETTPTTETEQTFILGKKKKKKITFSGLFHDKCG